ncbi:hypothetical protein ACJMK2_033283 [Sinanodonta woodiana]|uniref:Uncharacterized protein n=1 Tax=Sinanodonta woodiana TaxID=1069815 RepID=A0ABD3WMW9_SINWO
MDVGKESDVHQTNTSKDGHSQDSNDTSNASEETKQKPLLPNYCDKDNVKGKVVLVVNEEFQYKALERKGAKKDLENLRDVFLKKLGFEQLNVNQEFNLQKKELENLLTVTSEMKYNDTDVFVFAISTHGEERSRDSMQKEHALMCSDEEYVFTTDIIDSFRNNTSLDGKPKIFFIQACRIPYDADTTTDANIYDPGHKVKITTNPAKEAIVIKNNESEISGPMHTIHTVTEKFDKCSLTENNDQAHATQEQVDAGHRSENAQTSQAQGKSVIEQRIENEGRRQQGSGDPGPNSICFLSYNRCPKDCLVVYAIQSGLLAWRNEVDGSWMFHYLHEVIGDYKGSSFVDFFDVLTKTAFRMAKRETNTNDKLTHCKKAVPVIQHRLTKHLNIPLKTLKE